MRDRIRRRNIHVKIAVYNFAVVHISMLHPEPAVGYRIEFIRYCQVKERHEEQKTAKKNISVGTFLLFL